MKAVRFHQHRSPDVLLHEEVPDPVPAAAGALMRIRACALNHLDLQPGLSCGCEGCLSGRDNECGFFEAIRYDQDISEEINRLTNRRGVDVVIEHVGEATRPMSARSLAGGGRLVTCGATTGYHGSLDLRVLLTKQLSILGSYMSTRSKLLRAARFFFARQLKPVIDSVPLAEAAQAHRRPGEAAQFGKIAHEVQ